MCCAIKHYSLVIDPLLVKQIDNLIRQHGLFSSRSDFIRDAIRARLIEVRKNILGKEVKEQEGKKGLEREKAGKGKQGKEEAEEEEAAEEAMEEMEEYKFGGVH